MLKTSGDTAIQREYPKVGAKDIFLFTDQLGISHNEINDSLNILNRKGYIKAAGSMNEIAVFMITTSGFDRYARQFIPNFDSICIQVISQIVNNGKTSNKTIAKEINQPLMIVSHILEILKNRGFIITAMCCGNNMILSNVSPELKRFLQ